MGNYESFLKARGIFDKDATVAQLSNSEENISDSDKQQVKILSNAQEQDVLQEVSKDDGASKQTTNKSQTGTKKPK